MIVAELKEIADNYDMGSRCVETSILVIAEVTASQANARADKPPGGTQVFSRAKTLIDNLAEGEK